MAKELAIVLTNGGVNSAVTTALAAQKHRPVLLYAEIVAEPGSRARAAYDLQVGHFKPYREHTLPMPFLSPLVDPRPAPRTPATDPRHPSPLGPLMLELLPLVSAAARFAVHYEAAAIYLGLRVGGAEHNPQSTDRGQADGLAQATEYVQIWNEMLNLPCGRPDLEVLTPLLELEPWQVVDVGFQAATPFDKTWSCTEEGHEPCWACRGCRAREAAFQQAGKPDPLRVARR